MWTYGLRSITAGASLACMQVLIHLVPRTCCHTTARNQPWLPQALTAVNFVLAFTLTSLTWTQRKRFEYRRFVLEQCAT
jgi:hypothetical protein